MIYSDYKQYIVNYLVDPGILYYKIDNIRQ